MQHPVRGSFLYPKLNELIIRIALQVLHKAGWVHRDISTGNILTTDDQALLADFEFAKQEAGEDNLNIVGSL